MLPNLFGSSTLPVLDQVVQFTQARHGVLAGNIANLNTPGYKSRDLSPEAFQESLKQAIDSSRPGRSPGEGVVLGDLARGAVTPAGGGFDPEALAGVRDAMKTPIYHDGRDVNLELQITEINKNQAQHNLAITLMSTQFRLLRSAISENVS